MPSQNDFDLLLKTAQSKNRFYDNLRTGKPAYDDNGNKVEILDGDTFRVNNKPIRLSNIDTPEIDHPEHNKKASNHAAGMEARDYLAGLLSNSSNTHFGYKNMDVHNKRMVGDISMRDTTGAMAYRNPDKALVEGGYAKVFEKYNNDPALNIAQKAAERLGVGLYQRKWNGALNDVAESRYGVKSNLSSLNLGGVDVYSDDFNKKVSSLYKTLSDARKEVDDFGIKDGTSLAMNRLLGNEKKVKQLESKLDTARKAAAKIGYQENQLEAAHIAPDIALDLAITAPLALAPELAAVKYSETAKRMFDSYNKMNYVKQAIPEAARWGAAEYAGSRLMGYDDEHALERAKYAAGGTAALMGGIGGVAMTGRGVKSLIGSGGSSKSSGGKFSEALDNFNAHTEETSVNPNDIGSFMHSGTESSTTLDDSISDVEKAFSSKKESKVDTPKIKSSEEKPNTLTPEERLEADEAFGYTKEEAEALRKEADSVFGEDLPKREEPIIEYKTEPMSKEERIANGIEDNTPLSQENTESVFSAKGGNDASVLFNKDKLDKEIKETSSVKSREKIVDMNIDDFLGLAKKQDGWLQRDKVEKIKDSIKNGDELRDIPFLKTEKDQVVGHEGRHRAVALKEMGYETMPVKIKDSEIRFGENAESIPEKLKGEDNDSFSVAHPVTKNKEIEKEIKPEAKVSEPIKAHKEVKQPEQKAINQTKETIDTQKNQIVNTVEQKAAVEPNANLDARGIVKKYNNMRNNNEPFTLDDIVSDLHHAYGEKLEDAIKRKLVEVVEAKKKDGTYKYKTDVKEFVDYFNSLANGTKMPMYPTNYGTVIQKVLREFTGDAKVKIPMNNAANGYVNITKGVKNIENVFEHLKVLSHSPSEKGKFQRMSNAMSDILAPMLNKINRITKSETKIKVGTENSYSHDKDLITLKPDKNGNLNRREFLHETAHAATSKVIDLVEHIKKLEKNGGDAEALKKAFGSRWKEVDEAHSMINDLRIKINKEKYTNGSGNPYHFANNKEFVAEAFSNGAFQDLLKGIVNEGAKLSFLDNIIDYISKILGIERNALSEVISASKYMVDATKDDFGSIAKETLSKNIVDHLDVKDVNDVIKGKVEKIIDDVSTYAKDSVSTTEKLIGMTTEEARKVVEEAVGKASNKAPSWIKGILDSVRVFNKETSKSVYSNLVSDISENIVDKFINKAIASRTHADSMYEVMRSQLRGNLMRPFVKYFGKDKEAMTFAQEAMTMIAVRCDYGVIRHHGFTSANDAMRFISKNPEYRRLYTSLKGEINQTAKGIVDHKYQNNANFYNNAESLGIAKGLTEDEVRIVDELISIRAIDKEHWDVIKAFRDEEWFTNSVAFSDAYRNKSKQVFGSDSALLQKGYHLDLQNDGLYKFSKDADGNIVKTGVWEIEPAYIQGAIPSNPLVKKARGVDPYEAIRNMPEHNMISLLKKEKAITTDATKIKEINDKIKLLNDDIKLAKDELKKKIDEGKSFKVLRGSDGKVKGYRRIDDSLSDYETLNKNMKIQDVISESHSLIFHVEELQKVIDSIKTMDGTFYSSKPVKGWTELTKQDKEMFPTDLRSIINYVPEEKFHEIVGNKQLGYRQGHNVLNFVSMAARDAMNEFKGVIIKANPKIWVVNAVGSVTTAIRAGVPANKIFQYMKESQELYKSFRLDYQNFIKGKVTGNTKMEQEYLKKLEANPLYLANKEGMSFMMAHNPMGLSPKHSMLGNIAKDGIKKVAGEKASDLIFNALSKYTFQDNQQTGRFAASMLSRIDSFGRYSIIKHRMSEGKTMEEAVREANSLFGNSNKINPKVIQLLDQHFVPFVGWAYRVFGGNMKHIKDHPVQAFGVTAFLYGMSQSTGFRTSSYDPSQIPLSSLNMIDRAGIDHLNPIHLTPLTEQLRSSYEEKSITPILFSKNSFQ